MSNFLMAVLLAALVGSMHCVGMCGPLVAFYAGSDDSRGFGKLFSHTAYNGGRLVTYAMLGAAAGGLGAILDLVGRSAGIQRVAAVVAGVVMIFWGVIALLTALNVRIFKPAKRGALGEFAAKRISSLREKPPIMRALLIGLFSTLLPCGWLWAFAVIASGTGGALADDRI